MPELINAAIYCRTSSDTRSRVDGEKSCPEQLEECRALCKREGYKIIGVSADDQRKQTGFKEKQNLPFPLIPDTDKKVIHDYGVWGPKKFMGKEYDGIHRLSFLIDKTGKIIHVFDKFKTKDHHVAVLAAL